MAPPYSSSGRDKLVRTLPCFHFSLPSSVEAVVFRSLNSTLFEITTNERERDRENENAVQSSTARRQQLPLAPTATPTTELDALRIRGGQDRPPSELSEPTLTPPAAAASERDIPPKRAEPGHPAPAAVSHDGEDNDGAGFHYGKYLNSNNTY